MRGSDGQMARARNWREVRAEALKDGRITEAGIADARRVHDEQAQAYHLRQVREQLMTRQADIAAAMHVSQSRVSRIERGDISHAEVGTLNAYVRALGGVLRITADFGDRILALGALPTASLAEPAHGPGRRRSGRASTVISDLAGGQNLLAAPSDEPESIGAGASPRPGDDHGRTLDIARLVLLLPATALPRKSIEHGVAALPEPQRAEANEILDRLGW
jgi:predicted XRE-type DNA-binding protein